MAVWFVFNSNFPIGEAVAAIGICIEKDIGSLLTLIIENAGSKTGEPRVKQLLGGADTNRKEV